MERQLAPIGVADSGLGGFSVVKALQSALPNEDILYFGDTANCPYGNKTKDELLNLSGNMLSFLERRGAKCLALACNTTSALAPQLRMRIGAPIITIAECAANAAIGKEAVGVIATKFTAAGGIYNRCIGAISPATRVFSIGSGNLAALVEQQADDAAIDAEIRFCMAQLLQQSELHDVILGCTHYPLVIGRFQACYPGLRFIDPAPLQAAEIRRYLSEKNLLAPKRRAKLTVFTSGNPEDFRTFCTQNGFGETYDMEFIGL